MKYFLLIAAFLLVLSLNSYAQIADSTERVTIRLYCAQGFAPKNQPLYVLKDAKEEITLKQVDLKVVDPDWIQKVEVLKKEAGTDKYGHAGSGGVIIITLKKAKLQQAKESLEM